MYMYCYPGVKELELHAMDNTTLPAPNLRIGDRAPGFSARSTAGDIALTDYRGKWLLLFSHPADFTPVCTSEFVALASAQKQFAQLNCQLVALSVDSLFSHFAWIRAIRDRFDVEVRFPIVEDPTLVIGSAYGMVSNDAADSATMRTTFFIDPDGIVRATHCYPATVGRSVDEMLRTLQALQAVDANGALAPANWQPGQKMLLPAQPTLDSVLSAKNPSDWFFSSGDKP